MSQPNAMAEWATAHERHEVIKREYYIEEEGCPLCLKEEKEDELRARQVASQMATNNIKAMFGLI